MMTVHKRGSLAFNWPIGDPTPVELKSIADAFLRGESRISLTHAMWTSLEQGDYLIADVHMHQDDTTRYGFVALEFLHSVTVFSDAERERMSTA